MKVAARQTDLVRLHHVEAPATWQVIDNAFLVVHFNAGLPPRQEAQLRDLRTMGEPISITLRGLTQRRAAIIGFEESEFTFYLSLTEAAADH